MVKDIVKGDSGVNKDKIPVSIKLIIPTGETKLAPSVGTNLGQYKVNLVEFLKDFNSRTEDYEPGVLLRVGVTKRLSEKTYIIKIMPPSLTFLLQMQLISDDQEGGVVDLSTLRRIDKKLLYDVVRVYSILHNCTLFNSAKSVFGFLKSTGIKHIG